MEEHSESVKDLIRTYVSSCRELGGKDAIEFARGWSSVYQGGNMWASLDCYLTAMRDIIGLRLPEHENYKYWEITAIEGSFRVIHPDFCIVSDFPETIRLDERERPHCATGPSHRWRDGFEIYHWHGVRIPDRWIMEPGFLTASMALKESNLELRRAACEILGWSKILNDLKAITIDEDGDPEIGTLVEADLPSPNGTVKARFLRVLCGTGREFAICVPRNVGTAIAAQAWCQGLGEADFSRWEVRT